MLCEGSGKHFVNQFEGNVSQINSPIIRLSISDPWQFRQGKYLALYSVTPQFCNLDEQDGWTFSLILCLVTLSLFQSVK